MTVNDERTIGQPKEIRFINSNYDLLFKIPDGGYVEIKFEDGRIKAYQCRFLDPYHFCTADGRSWHICEFAETMERIGAKYYESPEKHEVWSDMDLDLDDWRDDLQEEYPELDENGLYAKMLELNSDYLDDERSNLKQPIGGSLLVIADLGLWNGRHQGYREKADADLSDCLDYRYDSAEWYVDRNGEFCGSQAHHDGTNHYVYRKIKDSATNDDIDDLEAKPYNGTATQKNIDRVTEKLGDRVAKVYGWELPEKVYRFAPEKEKIRDEGRYTNFVRKNMFDISDIKDPEPDVQPTYTAAEAVQGLFAHKAVDVRMIPDYPSDRQFGAFYDAEANCVYAKRGMGYEQIFTDVAVALAHAEMAKDIEGYLPAEHQFEARCAAYVLAKKYGVSTKTVEIDRVPEEYGIMDAAGIRENLTRIHDSVKNISSGMYKALVKEKEQEVSPKEKPGKGGDAR